MNHALIHGDPDGQWTRFLVSG